MEYGIISCIPIAVLIIGALITKKMAEMILLSTVVASILIYKGGFFSGYIEMIYISLSNPSFQFLLVLLLGFGGMIKLFERSGALMGFGNVISKFATTPRKAMVATWVMGIIVFVDDYLNVLSVSVSMRGVTDKLGIPREHLAYGVNSMGACVCVLLPFTTWAAFATGCIKDMDMGYADYVRAIPFMFFPWVAIIVCLLVAVGIVPKVGPIKKAYQRVAEGGPVLLEEKTGSSIVNLEMDDDIKPSSPINLILPIIVLVVVMFIFDNDVIHGIVAAVICQAVLYLVQRIMSLTEFVNYFFEGLSSMATLSFVICMAYILGHANSVMQFPEYVIGVMTKTISPELLPMLTFVIVSLITFAAASFWVLILISAPIFIPLAVSMGVDPAMVLAAIMSGVAFGSKFCFYSDAVFMTSAGTGVSNMTQIKAVAPYVLGSAVLAAILFAIAGFVTM